MSEPIRQIVIEQVRLMDEGERLVWQWSAFGDEKLIKQGDAPSLSYALARARDYVDFGIIPD